MQCKINEQRTISYKSVIIAITIEDVVFIHSKTRLNYGMVIKQLFNSIICFH